MRRIVSIVLTLVLGAGLLASRATAAPKDENHCINPAGVDLNELYDTNDAFIAPFCTEMDAGDTWRPITRIQVASTFESIPDGYVPIGDTPLEDFLLKFESATYVVDEGTRQERTFTYSTDDLIVVTGDLPDGTQFVSWTPRLRPLPPGEHTIDVYITMTSDHWDGLDADPSANLIPGGESQPGDIDFLVNDGSNEEP